MLFASMTFLWVFLPALLIVYFLAKEKYKNVILLIFSLIFYSWGEPKYIFLMIFSILLNYFLGLLIGKNKGNIKKLLFILSIILNIGLLAYFKYFNFIVNNLNKIFTNNIIEAKEIALPIGISFYTFQILSYIIDLYKGEIKAQNIDLYYFIAPEKSTIYKELLPQNIKIENDINFVQELCDYLKSESIENIFYPYNELMEAKKIAPLYFRLDSHWNLYGGFIGASVLQNQIDSNYNYLFEEAKISKGDFYESSGDLSRILNISEMKKFKEQKVNIENFLDDSKYIVTDNTVVYTYINENALIDKNLVIIGDSYNDAISNNFAKIYSKITYFPLYAYSQEFLDSLNPDIAIIEVVERNIDKIIHFTM